MPGGATEPQPLYRRAAGGYDAMVSRSEARGPMTFMLVVVEQPGERDVAPAEGKRRYETMQRFAADLDAQGKLVTAQSLLTPEESAVRIRHHDGARTMVDGPFAEAKEIIGGFFLLTVETRDEAVAIGNACPAAEWSIIEVRELGPCWDGAR